MIETFAIILDFFFTLFETYFTFLYFKGYRMYFK